MANWDSFDTSGNVEDRRGMTPSLIGGGGIVALLLALGLNFLGLNVSPTDVQKAIDTVQVLQGGQADPNTQPAEFKGEDSYEVFTKKVLGSTNATWDGIFARTGQVYRQPKLVLFRQATQSGCGAAVTEVGPHFCPTDGTIYVDETFFDELKNRFGAQSGDVAQAYVIAHEVGHNVQAQLGAFDNGAPSNAQSVQIELQADCYAGVWAYSVKSQGDFTSSDIDQALSAAAAVGDDHVQEVTTGRVDRESWTHGSSEQRKAAFVRGYESGKPDMCTDF